MTSHADEETPLLSSLAAKKTPIPWAQFSVTMYIQLAEPLTALLIYPFAPQLIRDLGITHGDEVKVGYYVGILHSLFYLAEAATILHWSRTSDHVGRKPVILLGLFGLSLSMYCVGLSKGFWGLVLSRALSGALNGNIGVIKSIMFEISDTTNIAELYAYTPIAWTTGVTLGPMIGGSLSRPTDRFPNVFGGNKFLSEYPYFLPCAVAATFGVTAWLVAFFFLKETVNNPVSVFEYFKPKNSKTSGTIRSPPATESNQDPSSSLKPVSLRGLMTPHVLITVGNYAMLALIDIAFWALQPLFLSTPIALGGLGLSPPVIGNIISLYGLLDGILQVLFFAKIIRRWGPRTTYIFGVCCIFLCFATFPVMSQAVKSQGAVTTLVLVILGLQVVTSLWISICYGTIFIFVSAASPNRASVGATNGFSQMTASIMRAIGPAAANSLFSLSMERGYLGGYLVFYVQMLLVCTAVFAGMFLPTKLWTN